MANDYKVVSDETISGLVTKVESEISDGLYPQGGLAVDTRKQDPVFLQALGTNQGGGGGGGSFKKLTSADYDYPSENPTAIAAWLLEPGYYVVDGTNVAISRISTEDHTIYYDTGDIFIKVSPASADVVTNPPNYLYTQNKNRVFSWFHGDDLKASVLTMQEIVDNLTSPSSNSPLSAKQGKVLKDALDNLGIYIGSSLPGSGVGSKLYVIYSDLGNSASYVGTYIWSTSASEFRKIAGPDINPTLSQVDSTPQYPLGKIYTDTFGNEFMYVKNCTGATLPEYDMQGYTICGFNELGTITIQSPDKDPSDNRMYFVVKTNNANYTYTQGDLEGLFVKVFNDSTEKLVTAQVIQTGNDVVTTEIGELVHRLYMPSSVAYNSSRELYIYSTGKGFLIRPNANSTEYGMRTMYGAKVVHPCAETVANGKYCWVYLGKTVHAAYSS